MSPDDFERSLRDRMKARARELDRTVSPPPPLRTLLATEGPFKPSKARTSFRLGLAVATVAVLALVVVTGSLLLQRSPESGPLSSVTPSSFPSLATPSPSLATASPLPATPYPSWSPQPPASTGVLTTLGPSLQDEGVLWAPDGRHFAVISLDGGSYNVYMFDKVGTWVGEAPGMVAVWVDDDTMIVLPNDPTSQDLLSTAYVAHIGYNDMSTMRALAGRYQGLLGNGTGIVALQTAQGYAIWRNGSLLPEVSGGGPLSVSSDGSLVAVEDSSGLKVVKTDSGQVVRSWPDLHTGAHATASFSPDGRHLAMTDINGSLNSGVVLDVSDGKKTTLLEGHFVYGGTWVGNDRIFAGDDAGAWWLLSLGGAKTRLTDVPDWWYGAVSSGGSVAADDLHAGSGTKLRITKSGKTTTLALPCQGMYLHWSPDGTELVVGCDSQVLLVRP